MPMNFEFYIKITFALFLGLLIGIDRQLKHKRLDIKTSIVICVASCLITVISIESVTKYVDDIELLIILTTLTLKEEFRRWKRKY